MNTKKSNADVPVFYLSSRSDERCSGFVWRQTLITFSMSSGGVLPPTTRCCWVLGCVMRQAHLMLPGLMCSGEFGVLLLLVLLCCVCGSTTGSLRVVCFAAYPVRSSPGLSLRMS